jgi:hypothetical protein
MGGHPRVTHLSRFAAGFVDVRQTFFGAAMILAAKPAGSAAAVG